MLSCSFEYITVHTPQVFGKVTQKHLSTGEGINKSRTKKGILSTFFIMMVDKCQLEQLAAELRVTLKKELPKGKYFKLHQNESKVKFQIFQ